MTANTNESDLQFLLKTTQHLSESFEGRLVGSVGGKSAADFIASLMSEIGLQPLLQPQPSNELTADSKTHVSSYQQFIHPFTHFFPRVSSDVNCQNVIGCLLAPTSSSSTLAINDSPKFVVVTAHYDHLGIQAHSGRPYAGADDNASGVAGLLMMARCLKRLAERVEADESDDDDFGLRTYRQQHHFIFIATDGEEQGYWGAQAFLDSFSQHLFQIEAFVNQSPTFVKVTREDLAFNLNIDQLGRPFKRHVAEVIGLSPVKSHFQHPYLGRFVEQVSSFRLLPSEDEHQSVSSEAIIDAISSLNEIANNKSCNSQSTVENSASRAESESTSLFASAFSKSTSSCAASSSTSAQSRSSSILLFQNNNVSLNAMMADHSVFHEFSIPFLAFCVPTHVHYHTPDDVYENLDHKFFCTYASAVTEFAQILDENLEEILNLHQIYVKQSQAQIREEFQKALAETNELEDFGLDSWM